jgi:hypothetical protein
MKFAGTLSVICPTDRIEKIYGDRLLNSFTQIFDETTGSTRTKLTEDSMREYQQSVRNGNEVDSDGRNMLVYDIKRDVIQFPTQDPNETVEDYEQRIKLLAKRNILS